MRMVSIRQVLRFMKLSSSRTSRGRVEHRATPEFTALESDFFARGADEERTANGGSLWDTQQLLIRARR